jgi:two-component system, LytTR family, response regulator
MIRTLIIDDEADARHVLRLALTRFFPEVTIIGVCESPEQGLEAIRTLQPDLLFLDVQMPHLSGFDLLKLVSPFNFEVIFVTAHDQYAIKAIRFSALDYLLKPVDTDDLRAAIEKAKIRLVQKNTYHQYQSVLHNIGHKAGKIDRLAVPTFEGIEFFNTADIIYCQADGNYTTLFLTGNRRKLISRNLKDLEHFLTEPDFCRVHHSSLIHLKHVQKYVKGEGGYVILSDNHHVDISRRKKDEFLGMLNKV